jgi:cell wall-associated NlpC family hydrolase
MLRNILYSSAFLFLIGGCATLAPPPGEPPHAARRPLPQTGPEHAEALLQAILALGVDYRYGGRSPQTGFDCSGLVAHVYLQAWGLELPRDARAQSEAGIEINDGELQAGDLVFYNTLGRPFSHVGIYLGDGRFVHAPKTGASVRVERMRTTYWVTRFDGARRLTPPGLTPAADR